MEFLRFAGSIPGSYWGCCAVDVIQCFDKDPDTSASIQIVCGDGGQPLTRGGEELFFGPTYGDIFRNRIRTGTFGTGDMPNHAFLAVLTDSQVRSTVGKKWLKMMADEGFEFVRAIDNSVYTSSQVIDKAGEPKVLSSHPNYIFGLFRNIGRGYIKDPFQPPEEWLEVSDLTARNSTHLKRQKQQLKAWQALAKTTVMTRSEVEAAGVPITLAGKRSLNPQELETVRKDAGRYEEDELDPFDIEDEYEEEY